MRTLARTITIVSSPGTAHAQGAAKALPNDLAAEVPARGSERPAIRVRPDTVSRTMSAHTARRAYGWLGARPARAAARTRRGVR